MTTDPLPPVVGRTTRRLARRVRRAEVAIGRNARASQAGRRSIEDGDTLPFYDPDGTIRVLIGADPDNPDTYTVQDVNGPALDRPSAPLVASTYEAVTITWDGFDADGQAGWPADFARLEVHASTVNPFTPTADTQIDAFRSPAGGTCTIPLPYDTALWVRFVVVNTSGVQSVPSVARLAQSTNELADPVIYRPTVYGGAFSTADPDAPDEGQRVVVRNDESAGVVEFYSGVADETPGMLNPAAAAGAIPSVELTPPSDPTHPAVAKLRLGAGPEYDELTGGGSDAILTGDVVYIQGRTVQVAADAIGLLGPVDATMSGGSVGTGRFLDTVVAAGGITQLATGADTTATSTAYVTVPDLEATIYPRAYVDITYRVDLDIDHQVDAVSTVGGTGSSVTELLLDGVPYGPPVILTATVGGRAAGHRTILVSGLTGGVVVPHYLTVRTRSGNNSTTSRVRAGSTMTLTRVG